MGLLLHQQHNDSAAVRYFTEALDIFTRQHDIFNEATTRKGLYEALRHTDPTAAMVHNDRYLALHDSLYDRETGILLTKYMAERGYDELLTENEVLRSTRRTYIAIGLAVATVLLLLIVYLLWRSRRDRRQPVSLISKVAALHSAQIAGQSAAVSYPSPPVPTADDFTLRVIATVNESLPTGHYSVEDCRLAQHGCAGLPPACEGGFRPVTENLYPSNLDGTGR